MLLNGAIPIKLKPSELNQFNWITSIAPCFMVNAKNINIITDPRKFYETLCERFKYANQKISIASLYIGTGNMERQLMEITKNSVKSKELKFNVLLDYQRGTRGEVNSRTLLHELLSETPNQCSVSLFQTPWLRGSWSKALPSRYNELVGLQHMKLYIADDSVILSGANCSHDYFTNRQDRYIEIKDNRLADFYFELIEEVSNFSKKCVKDEIIDMEYEKKELMVQEMNINITRLIDQWKISQAAKCIEESYDTRDTWIFPLVQMGVFNIKQDEYATRQILATAPKGSCIRLATGYFNLTEHYATALLKECKANISLLMAHPNANGFLGATGPAGGIPHAYSLLAKKFLEKVVNSNQASRVSLLEYERDGWTFHAKGLCSPKLSTGSEPHASEELAESALHVYTNVKKHAVKFHTNGPFLEDYFSIFWEKLGF